MYKFFHHKTLFFSVLLLILTGCNDNSSTYNSSVKKSFVSHQSIQEVSQCIWHKWNQQAWSVGNLVLRKMNQQQIVIKNSENTETLNITASPQYLVIQYIYKTRLSKAQIVSRSAIIHSCL